MLLFSRYRILCFSLALCVGGQQGLAQTTKPFPAPERVCVQEGTTRKVKLALFLREYFQSETYRVSSHCVDRDKNGSDSLEERQLILSQNADFNGCEANDEYKAGILREAIVKFFDTPPSSYSIERVKIGANRTAADEFIQGSSAIVVRCNEKDKPAGLAGKDKAKSAPGSGPSWTVKLRGDQKSLPYAQGSDEFKKLATAAKLSISDDKLADRVRYNTAATIGVDTNDTLGPFRFIPYTKWESQHSKPQVKKSTAPDDREINMLTLGNVTAVDLWTYGSPISSLITFDPQLIIDQEVQSRIFGTTLIWTPTLGLGQGSTFPPGNVPIIPNLAYAHLYVSGVVRVGRVLDYGLDPTLQVKQNFTYYGPETRLVLTGASVLEPFKIDLTYHHLWGDGGEHVVPERFTAVLSYSFDKEGNFEASLKWDTGRDYEAFKKRQMLVTSFGYKF